ncbi:MAG: hypothetical protein A2V88_06200 [Elusimicrobia bacterium RBG_16_66_12]|nr:MAG: hypothetical protein A2V88_06200 [Elusimicrobia bacterium RBG_16_66_12]
MLASLISALPGLLGGLFGGDPKAKQRRQVAALLTPEKLQALTNQFYQQAIASPAFSQAQGTIAAGANVAGNQLRANLGARGIGTSGSAAVLSSLVPSLVGSQMAGVRTAAHGTAQQQAQESIRRQIENLVGTGGPTRGQELFGAGLGTFGNVLKNYFASKNPELAKLFAG